MNTRDSQNQGLFPKNKQIKMKNDYLQEEQQTIDTINKSFLIDIAVITVYVFTFLKINGKLASEKKFFMHLTNDQVFISRLLFIFWIIALCTISLLIILYLMKRFFLKKYRLIKSNLFFLNNKWVVSLNCLLKICSYTMMTISFMSLERLLLTFTFISLLSWIEKKKSSESKLNQEVFSWRDKNLSKLFAYSLIVAISSPVYNAISGGKFIQKLNTSSIQLANKTKESFPPEVHKFISDTFSNIPFSSLLLSAKKILENILSSKETKGGVFIIILINFVKETISQSIISFKSFWEEVTATTKRVEWFKLFSNFQLAVKNKKTRNFYHSINSFPSLCYESFSLNPNFVKQSYIENIDSFSRNFTEKIEEVNELIKTINDKANEEKEKIFILYWLFNHVNSFQDFSLYSKAVNKISKS